MASVAAQFCPAGAAPQRTAEAERRIWRGPYADGIARLGLLLAEGLEAAHNAGIMHQDIKPSNVLLGWSGRPMLLDFNLSAEVGRADRGFCGTLAYMAPELFKNEQPTPAADLFSAGVIAAEVFTGRNPFQRDNSGALIYAIITEPPDLTGLDAPLAAVLERLMAKLPLRRYPTAESAIAALCAATGYPLPPESAAVRESFLQASRFVGRQTELTTLNDALRRGLRDMNDPPKRRGSFRTQSVDLGRSKIGSIANVAEALAIAEGEGFK